MSNKTGERFFPSLFLLLDRREASWSGVLYIDSGEQRLRQFGRVSAWLVWSASRCTYFLFAGVVLLFSYLVKPDGKPGSAGDWMVFGRCGWAVGWLGWV